MRGETSHKFIDLSANPIMKFYYERVSQWMENHTKVFMVVSFYM